MRVCGKSPHVTWEVSCPACVALPPFGQTHTLLLLGQAASPGSGFGALPRYRAVSIRLSIASAIAADPANSAVFPVRTRCGNLRKTIRFTRRTERIIPSSRYGSGGIVGMEHSKLVNGNGHGAQIGRSASPAQQDQMSTARSAGKKAVRKKTASRKAKVARPLRKKMDSELEIKEAGLSLLRQRRPCSKFYQAA